MRNIAIILAGGVGSRLGCEEPKQFCLLAGRTVIEHTIDAFDSHPFIDEVAVVMHPNWLDRMEQIRARNGWTKVRRLLVGGEERYASTLAAIEAYADGGEANLLLHDAARPLVSKRIISDVVAALEGCAAVAVAMPTADTIFELDAEERHVQAIPSRRYLRRAQTPQAFRLSLIAEAYRRALADASFAPTDDCAAVLRYVPQQPIAVVEGEGRNLKLTYPEDLAFLEQLVRAEAEQS